MSKSVYPDMQSRSAALYQRACRVYPGGNTRLAVHQLPYPIFTAHAAGSRVTDADGVERIDFINNQSVLIHGHCFPPAMQAVEMQLKKGTCFSGPCEIDVEMAELLISRSPGFEKVRFTNAGTESVMMAVKAARAYTGKFKIAKCEGAYHGGYDFVEASRAPSPANWGDSAAPTPVPYTKGTPSSIMQDMVVFRYNDVAVARSILERHKTELAAVIVEPVANRSGLIPAEPAFLDFLREFCSRNKVVLIFDEVITFRLAVGGAQQRYGLNADLTALGKTIGGGFPAGAVAGRSDIMGVFDATAGSPAVPHTGTFNANPVSMAAGLETVKRMDAEFLKRLNARGDALREELNQVFTRKGIEGQVTGAGSLFKIHFKSGKLTDYRSAYPDAAATARQKALFGALLNEGFLLSVTCSGNVSGAHTDAEIERFVAACTKNLEGADASVRDKQPVGA
jgi:glutamate-1-semialdehyde 2,1-aminomutase